MLAANGMSDVLTEGEELLLGIALICFCLLMLASLVLACFRRTAKAGVICGTIVACLGIVPAVVHARQYHGVMDYISGLSVANLICLSPIVLGLTAIIVGSMRRRKPAGPSAP